MVAALREGWRRGFRIFRIYGSTGGRLDHPLANIQCIAALARLVDADTCSTGMSSLRQSAMTALLSRPFPKNIQEVKT